MCKEIWKLPNASTSAIVPIRTRAPRKQTMEDTAVPVGPVHHGRDGETVVENVQKLTLCRKRVGTEIAHLAAIATPKAAV